jgi:hypothetical protein
LEKLENGELKKKGHLCGCAAESVREVDNASEKYAAAPRIFVQEEP